MPWMCWQIQTLGPFLLGISTLKVRSRGWNAASNQQVQQNDRFEPYLCSVFFWKKDNNDYWLVVSNIVYFHLYLGKVSNLTNIFQLGWNHRLDYIWLPWLEPTQQNSTSWHRKNEKNICERRFFTCYGSHWKLACPGWMHWLSRSGVCFIWRRIFLFIYIYIFIYTYF